MSIGDLPIPMLIVIAIVVLYLLNSIKILREYERGVIFRLGRALPIAQGARHHPRLPAPRPDGAHLAAPGGAGGSAAGRDHARQRHPQGERGGHALRGESQRRRHQGGQLRLPDLAVCADHAALGAGRGGAGRAAEPSRQAQPAGSSPSSTSARSRSASR